MFADGDFLNTIYILVQKMSLYHMTKIGYGHRKHLKFAKIPKLKMEKWLVHTGMSMHPYVVNCICLQIWRSHMLPMCPSVFFPDSYTGKMLVPIRTRLSLTLYIHTCLPEHTCTVTHMHVHAYTHAEGVRGQLWTCAFPKKYHFVFKINLKPSMRNRLLK